MAQTDQRVLYSIPELAAQIGRTPIAARRLVERGVVPSRRLGGRVVILADELDSFLKSLPPGARMSSPASPGSRNVVRQPERRGGADTRGESP
jgi:hypothetical protein